jgi:hypothetical protein
MHPGFNYYNGFAGSILPSDIGYFDGGMNLQLSLYPMDGLAFHFGFEMDGTAEENYVDGLRFQIAYTVPGAGTAALGFVNAPEGDAKNLYVQYYHPLGEMKVELGVNFGFGEKIAGNDVSSPINIGLGFGYGSPWRSDFWLNARVGASIGIEKSDPNLLGFDVVASYDLDIFRIYIPVGIAMVLPEQGDSLMAWNFSPYIRKSLGNLDFYAGLMLYNGGIDDNSGAGPWYPRITPANKDVINWAIPIAIHWVWG